MEIATRIERLRIEMETADLWVALEYLTSAEESVAGLPSAPESPRSSTREQQP
jgi:hypothetical protein